MSADYYKILGVDEKADKAAIKKKYRELAKKYHPDRNHGNRQAEEKFKEISAAYDVIGDDKKRRQYDDMRRFGAGPGMAGGFPGGRGGGRFYTEGDFSNVFGNGFSFDDLSGPGGIGDIFSSIFGGNVRTRRTRTQRPRGPQKGRNLRAELKITFLQAARGITKKIKIAVPETCSACGGSGSVTGSEPKICTRCHGTGQVTNVQGAFSISRPCPACLGRGATQTADCTTCRGRGSFKKKKTVAIKIPPGIADGETIKLRGLGFPGKQGGPKGDLNIKVKVMEHQQYQREGNDIHTAVDISFPQAALGCKVPVKTLSKKIMLNIPAGTQPGTVLRLKGVGLTTGDKPGDMLVKINITVPTTLTDRQKELLTEFESLTEKVSP